MTLPLMSTCHATSHQVFRPAAPLQQLWNTTVMKWDVIADELGGQRPDQSTFGNRWFDTLLIPLNVNAPQIPRS
jgi:hypothetical protein